MAPKQKPISKPRRACNDLFAYLRDKGHTPEKVLGSGAEGIAIKLSDNKVAKFWGDFDKGTSSFDIWENVENIPELKAATTKLYKAEIIELPTRTMGLTIAEETKSIDHPQCGEGRWYGQRYCRLEAAIMLTNWGYPQLACDICPAKWRHILAALRYLKTIYGDFEVIPGIGRATNGKLLIYDLI